MASGQDYMHAREAARKQEQANKSVAKKDARGGLVGQVAPSVPPGSEAIQADMEEADRLAQQSLEGKPQRLDPGRGGQTLSPDDLAMIEKLREWRDRHAAPQADEGAPPQKLHHMRNQIAKKYMDGFSEKEQARQQDLRDNPPEDLLAGEEDILGPDIEKTVGAAKDLL